MAALGFGPDFAGVVTTGFVSGVGLLVETGLACLDWVCLADGDGVSVEDGFVVGVVGEGRGVVVFAGIDLEAGEALGCAFGVASEG